MNPATALARALLAELVEQGVREVVLAPGSRSAPLAFAALRLAEEGRIRLHVRVDERSAAFVALGLAKVSGAPVAVMCTSGSAVANLTPAVVEASYSALPLVVVTADRPVEARGVGAPQTIDQVGFFGDLVRFAADLGAPRPPDPADPVAAERAARAAAAAAVGAALGSAVGHEHRPAAPQAGRRGTAGPAGAVGHAASAGRGGPVHLNVGFRLPLVPDPEDVGDPAAVVPTETAEHDDVVSSVGPGHDPPVRSVNPEAAAPVSAPYPDPDRPVLSVNPERDGSVPPANPHSDRLVLSVNPERDAPVPPTNPHAFAPTANRDPARPVLSVNQDPARPMLSVNPDPDPPPTAAIPDSDQPAPPANQDRVGPPAPADSARDLAGAIGEVPTSGVLVVGDLPCSEPHRHQHRLVELATACGWPILAEPSANLQGAPTALGHGVLVAGSEGFLAAHRPDLVVTAGLFGLSRPTMALVGGARRHLALDLPGVGREVCDPLRSAHLVLPEVPNPPIDHRPDLGWLRAWQEADAIAAEVVAEHVLDDGWSASAVAGHVWRLAPDDALLLIAASWPVRLVEAFGGRRDGLLVVGNRGTNGIDGLVSTAWGAALAHQARGGGPAVALLGDLAFLHDHNGLLVGADDQAPDLVLVVVDNDGGGIFHQLEQGRPEYATAFERLFGTPLGRDLVAIAEAAGVPALRVRDRSGLGDAMAAAIGAGGVRVVVADVPDRVGEAALLDRVRRAVADRLDRA